MKRQAVSKRTRFEVFKRDDFRCVYCGAHPPDVLLEADHITPVAEGGDNDIDNLATSCEACNRGKGPVPLTIIPETLALKAARVAEAEAQLAGFQAILAARRERLDEDAWRVVQALTGATTIYTYRFNSIRRFVDMLGVEHVLEAVAITLGSRAYTDNARFKYLCGVCWRMARE